MAVSVQVLPESCHQIVAEAVTMKADAGFFVLPSLHLSIFFLHGSEHSLVLASYNVVALGQSQHSYHSCSRFQHEYFSQHSEGCPTSEDRFCRAFSTTSTKVSCSKGGAAGPASPQEKGHGHFVGKACQAETPLCPSATNPLLGLLFL